MLFRNMPVKMFNTYRSGDASLKRNAYDIKYYVKVGSDNELRQPINWTYLFAMKLVFSFSYEDTSSNDIHNACLITKLSLLIKRDCSLSSQKRINVYSSDKQRYAPSKRSRGALPVTRFISIYTNSSKRDAQFLV